MNEETFREGLGLVERRLRAEGKLEEPFKTELWAYFKDHDGEIWAQACVNLSTKPLKIWEVTFNSFIKAVVEAQQEVALVNKNREQRRWEHTRGDAPRPMVQIMKELLKANPKNKFLREMAEESEAREKGGEKEVQRLRVQRKTKPMPQVKYPYRKEIKKRLEKPKDYDGKEAAEIPF